MFARFHVLVLPGGTSLGTQQASLLEHVVTSHGGSVISDASMVASVARSIARRRQKRLVIVSGRDSIPQVESDLVLACCVVVAQRTHAARGMMATAALSDSEKTLERRAVVAQRDLAAMRELVGTTVFFAKAEWITSSVSIGGSEPQDLVAFSVSPAAVPDNCDPAATGRGSSTTTSASAAQGSPFGQCTAESKVVVSPGPKHDTRTATANDDDDDGPTAGNVRGGGFIPVFFANGDRHDGHRKIRRDDTSTKQEGDHSNAAAKRPRDTASEEQMGGRDGRQRASGEGAEVRWMPSTLTTSTATETMHNNETARSQCCPGGASTASTDATWSCNPPHDALRLDSPPLLLRHSTTTTTTDDSEGNHSTAAASTTSSDLNEPLLSQLAQLKSIYQATGDTWRTYAYNRAIAIIKRLPFRVERVEQLSSYRGIGDRIRNKVREILETGSTVKLQVLQSAPLVGAMTEFTKIWGVGPATARRLAAAGLSDIAALRAAPNVQALLTQQQLAGLRHYEDLLERMPREEVTEIVNYVRGALMRLLGPDPQIDVVACGSYRRGKPTSGDVDVLLCDRRANSDDTLLIQLVRELGQQQHHHAKHRREQSQRLQRISTSSSSHNSSAASTATSVTLLLDGAKRTSNALHGTEADDSRSSSPQAYSSAVRLIDDDPQLASPNSAFIKEDLTVSHRGAEQVHCDSWFGIVQLPDCAMRHLCPCSHRAQSREEQQQPAASATPSSELHSTAAAAAPYTHGVHLCRRMDLKVYPPHQFPFALLYFTGSDYFNRSMRQFCQDHGWTLSDKELKPVVQVRRANVHEAARGIACHTERDIFEAVGLPFKEPHERET